MPYVYGVVLAVERHNVRYPDCLAVAFLRTGIIFVFARSLTCLSYLFLSRQHLQAPLVSSKQSDLGETRSSVFVCVCVCVQMISLLNSLFASIEEGVLPYQSYAHDTVRVNP